MKFKFRKVFEETAGLLKLVIYQFISSYETYDCSNKIFCQNIEIDHNL